MYAGGKPPQAVCPPNIRGLELVRLDINPAGSDSVIEVRKEGQTHTFKSDDGKIIYCRMLWCREKFVGVKYFPPTGRKLYMDIKNKGFIQDQVRCHMRVLERNLSKAEEIKTWDPSPSIFGFGGGKKQGFITTTEQGLFFLLEGDFSFIPEPCPQEGTNCDWDVNKPKERNDFGLNMEFLDHRIKNVMKKIPEEMERREKERVQKATTPPPAGEHEVPTPPPPPRGYDGESPSEDQDHRGKSPPVPEVEEL